MTKLKIEYFTGQSLEIDANQIMQFDYLPVKHTGTHNALSSGSDVEPHTRAKLLDPLEYVLYCAVNHRPIILKNGNGFGKLVSLSLHHIKEIKHADDLESKTNQ